MYRYGKRQITLCNERLGKGVYNIMPFQCWKTWSMIVFMHMYMRSKSLKMPMGMTNTKLRVEILLWSRVDKRSASSNSKVLKLGVGV